MKREHNASLFPLKGDEYDQGIGLRDWFAGQALMGLCAHPQNAHVDDVARMTYVMADAMLREREKET